MGTLYFCRKRTLRIFVHDYRGDILAAMLALRGPGYFYQSSGDGYDEMVGPFPTEAAILELFPDHEMYDPNVHKGGNSALPEV